MSFASLPLPLLELALNQALQLDPMSLAALAELDDKVIAVDSGLIRAYLLPHAQGIHLLAEYEGAADVSISGPPFTLLRLVQSRDSSLLSSDELQVEGDLRVAQRLMHVFAHLDIDWEEHLARRIGDQPAHWLGRGVQRLQNWQRESREAWQENLIEYIQEELRWLPPSEEVNAFMHDVDELRADVDRLEQRIHRLRARP